MIADDCFICRKHAGREPGPPGGFIHQDAHWWVCHGPAHMARLGTLIVESRRHLLDFADLTAAEAASLGPLLSRLYTALRRQLPVERIYSLLLLEGSPHFHLWLVPRLAGESTRGLDLLAATASCDGREAATLAASLAQALGEPGR